jgi:hypothetical protein
VYILFLYQIHMNTYFIYLNLFSKLRISQKFKRIIIQTLFIVTGIFYFNNFTEKLSEPPMPLSQTFHTLLCFLVQLSCYYSSFLTLLFPCALESDDINYSFRPKISDIVDCYAHVNAHLWTLILPPFLFNFHFCRIFLFLINCDFQSSVQH